MPTNDIERALVGSAMSSGRGVTWLNGSVFWRDFFSFLDFPRKRGPKHVVWTHAGWMAQEGSMQAGWMQYPEDLDSRLKLADLTKVGLTVHLKERSKSESIMCPSSRTNTFSGLRSL